MNDWSPSTNAATRRSGTLIIALALNLSFLAPAALAQPTTGGEQEGPAWATVQKLVHSFQTQSQSSPSTKGAGQQLDAHKQAGASVSNNQALPAELIDFKQIAMRSVGKEGWQSLSPGQKQDLTATIESLLQNRYYPRWQKIFGRGTVSYIGQSRVNGDIVVTTNLRLGHKDEKLEWQLTSSPTKVISLAVDQNDLLTKLSQRIQAHQAKSGYAAMIAWLKGKGRCDIADGAGSQSKTGTQGALKTSSRSVDTTLD